MPPCLDVHQGAPIYAGLTGERVKAPAVRVAVLRDDETHGAIVRGRYMHTCNTSVVQHVRQCNSLPYLRQIDWEDPMPITRRALIGSAASALLLTGCGTDDRATTSASTRNPRTPSRPPVKQLPVSSAFARAEWSIDYANAAQVGPLVLPEHVVVLNGAAVEAYGPDGKKQWAKRVDAFSKEDRVTDSDGGDLSAVPTLRALDSSTVAFIDTGSAKGKGLQDDSYVARVSLISLADGSLTTVNVKGSQSDSPKLTPFGVCFTLPDDGPGVIVNADGSTTKVRSDHGFFGTIGKTKVLGPTDSAPVQYDGTGRKERIGYDLGAWSTDKSAPLKTYTGVRIDAASNEDDLVLVTWTNSPPGGTSSKQKSRLIRASTGAVLDSSVPQIPLNATLFTASPNRNYLVAGPLLVTKSGTVHAIGGGTGQKTVDLMAVANDGTAYGLADDTFVTATNTGKTKTEPGADPTVSLLGIMTGNIAVHARDGVVTGNPVK